LLKLQNQQPTIKHQPAGHIHPREPEERANARELEGKMEGEREAEWDREQEYSESQGERKGGGGERRRGGGERETERARK